MDQGVARFDFQPTLVGSLVLLRPLAEDDFDALYRASSDPLIWEQLPGVERHKLAVFESFFAESISLKTTLVIVERSSQDIVGSSRYARFSGENCEVEIGWTFLCRRCWGKGHNSESKQLMLEHAFTYVNSVFFVAAATNQRSRKAIEKLGAMFVKKISWPPETDTCYESAMYRITKQDWNDIRMSQVR